MARSVCIHHTDRTATARCYTCHKPICSDCVVREGEGTFCGTACASNYTKFHAKFQSERPGFFGRIKRFMAACLVLVILAAILIVVGAKFLKLGFCEELLKSLGL
jgi:hypothetical protein